mmetsp:Transcript_41292/g.72535  ORF Transcript_41292/g.72535 Transcript_41292/m.72535 type:complete len:217 (+) Transcript_41292:307-957(+)
MTMTAMIPARYLHCLFISRFWLIPCRKRWDLLLTAPAMRLSIIRAFSLLHHLMSPLTYRHPSPHTIVAQIETLVIPPTLMAVHTLSVNRRLCGATFVWRTSFCRAQRGATPLWRLYRAQRRATSFWRAGCPRPRLERSGRRRRSARRRRRSAGLAQMHYASTSCARKAIVHVQRHLLCCLGVSTFSGAVHHKTLTHGCPANASPMYQQIISLDILQ